MYTAFSIRCGALPIFVIDWFLGGGKVRGRLISFFDALLNPPRHLLREIQETLAEFNALNEKIYAQTLDTLILREGISREDAIAYFHLLQLMVNGYFSSPTFQSLSLREKAETHEKLLPKLFDRMLYGIAKGEEK